MNQRSVGHKLDALFDGATSFQGGKGRPIPLTRTNISVQVTMGLATLTFLRRFQNDEEVPIEAVLTMPIGFDAVVTGLRATIDGRHLAAVACAKNSAREVYEAALDRGKMAVLHEEALQGLHILSIGQLAPGKEVAVELQAVVPLSSVRGQPFLRLPMTVGQIYGTSPLMPADDLVTGKAVHVAQLSVACDHGRARLGDGTDLSRDEPLEVVLNKAIEITIEGGWFGAVQGVTADRHVVELALKPVEVTENCLSLAILFDRSGSTHSPVGNGTTSIWAAMRAGLAEALTGARRGDQFELWQFDNHCSLLGKARGAKAATLLEKIGQPNGGTELGQAVHQVIAGGARDIHVLTDGHTWAHTVDDLLGSGARISAILVGESSLDVNIANLCAMTGGQLFYAPQADVASAVESALETLRLEGLAVSGTPEKLLCIRAGIEMTATVSKETAAGSLDPIGRYAAALSLPLLASEEAQFYAVKHGLCGHFTSPVLVDEAGSMVAGLPEMRKVELMAARSRCAPESPQFHRSPQSDVAFLKSLPTVTADRRSPAEPVVTPTNKGKGPLTWLQAVVRGNGGRQRQSSLANCARSIDCDNQAN